MDRRAKMHSLWLLLSLCAAASTSIYMHRVLGPWEYYKNVSHGTMKAALGDLYSPWMGTRAVLLEHRNPYGPEVTREIQMAFYGHPIVQNYDDPAKVVDEQRFVYPVYVVLLLAPIAHVEFATLHAWAPLVLGIFIVANVLLYRAIVRWPSSRMATTALIVFILASPQIVQGLRLRQLGLLAACLLAAGVWCIFRGHWISAGVVLAVSTIKPQMVVLPLVWVLFWVLADWRRRWRLAAGFVVTLLALIAAGEWILPGWLGYFVRGLAAYRHYGPSTSILEIGFGHGIGRTLCVVLVSWLLIWAWSKRKVDAGAQEFAVPLGALLVGTSIGFPLLPIFNQVLLILPVLIVLREWSGLSQFFRGALVICVSWPWIAAAGLLAFPPPESTPTLLPLLPSSLVLVVPFLLLVLLATRTPSLVEKVVSQ